MTSHLDVSAAVPCQVSDYGCELPISRFEFVDLGP